ncbi:MAG: PAS domain S-box protein, partial [Gammaproteobacteria bacterium]
MTVSPPTLDVPAEAPAASSPALAGVPVLQAAATGRFRRFNRMLERQLTQATGQRGLDLEQLLRLVSEHYNESEEERRGLVRSVQRLSSEAENLQRELGEQADSQLQAVLDHVKDAILTVDGNGLIDLFNPTAERIFGFAAPEVQGQSLAWLLPDLFPEGAVAAEVLETLATDREDTQLDLAALSTRGQRRDARRFDAEFAVSEATLQRQRVFILCLRDVSDRAVQAAENAAEKVILDKLATRASLEQALEAMLAALAPAMPDWRFAIQYLDAARGRLLHGVAPRLARAFVAAMDDLPAEAAGHGSGTAALRAAGEVWIADVLQDERWAHRAEAAALADIGSAW